MKDNVFCIILQGCFDKVIHVIKMESMVLGAVVGSMGIVEVIFEIYTLACPSNMPSGEGNRIILTR